MSLQIRLKGKQKKIPRRLLQNRAEWEENRRAILESIKNGKNSLSEIISQTSLSKTAILKHLKHMQSTHLIKQELVKKELVKTNQKPKKIIYVITEEGEKVISLGGIKPFLRSLEKITNNDGRIIYDYSELGIALTICSLPWGIDPHLIINNKL